MTIGEGIVKGGVTIAPLTGDDVQAALDQLAQLRIAVFRDFPYLYDGTRDYETNYLRSFADGRDGVIVTARDGEKIVGVATGSALSTHHAELQEPFAKSGYDISKIFYFGESVLMPEYRGRGIGHAFFDFREAQAKARGYKAATFCSVVRPSDHPARPADFTGLDSFWQKRGYRKAPGLIARFAWKDVGAERESEKPMQFWIKDF